ncbi:MAG: PsbP-related protein [Candidatus Nealsonbacteria bacterium]
MNKKFIIIAIVCLVIALIGGIFIYQNSKKSDNETNNEEETNQDLTADWVIYKSPTRGYQIKHPADWTMDDTGEIYQQSDVLMAPDKNAAIVITIFQDLRILEPNGIETIVKEVEDAFANDQNHVVKTFEKGTEGYVTGGSYSDGTENWAFKEVGVYMLDGIGVNVRANTKQEMAIKYGKTLDAIIESFKSIGE